MAAHKWFLSANQKANVEKEITVLESKSGLRGTAWYIYNIYKLLR